MEGVKFRALLFILLCLSVSSLRAERIFYLMGTYAVIDLPSEELTYRAYRYLKSLEEKLSDYIETSEVSLINRKAGVEPVRVSDQTLRVILIALKVAEETEGFFDPTVGAVTIKARRKKLFSETVARKYVDFRKVKVEGDRIFLPFKEMAIDLGGIGKGYAIEEVYNLLKTPKGFISIGGEIKVWGLSKILAVKDPVRGGVLFQMINRRDLCLSTSGNYIRKHIERKDEELIQVTTVYTDCTLADAYATALFSMPRELRRKFLSRHKELGVLEIFEDGSVYMNGAFLEYFSLIIRKGD